MGRGRPRKKRLRSRGADDDPALFPVGAEVEVRSDDPGFVASYYEATVEGYQHSDLSYVVAYSTLNRRDGGDSPLREVAAATNVRPRPPHRPPPRRGFAMHDMVDAFHNGGWWAGVVVCAVPPPEDDTAHRPCRVYRVCFPTSRELLDLEETALRPSRVFLDDCWLPAAAAKAVITNKRSAYSIPACFHWIGGLPTYIVIIFFNNTIISLSFSPLTTTTINAQTFTQILYF